MKLPIKSNKITNNTNTNNTNTKNKYQKQIPKITNNTKLQIIQKYGEYKNMTLQK